MTTSEVGALLRDIGGELFQQAWIVAEIKAAQEAMKAQLGCGEFVRFRMEQQWILRGKEVPCGLSLAFARSGNVQIELMQPISGEGIHVEFLATHGSGPHHFGVLVDELDAAVAAAARLGLTPVMSSDFGRVRLAYLDTMASIGMYLELVEDPDGLFVKTMPWRDDQRTGS